ncbi:unnamed protein product [Linum trigynum]|uniref:Negative regulator of systemic acquired resistance SNI1 n=1 Tax=Linum trigynum TaxID=586398 RepID=A0AAV2GHY1_9ROSI
MEVAVGKRKGGNRIVEENILAILDSDDRKDTRENNDNRSAFLEAVRSACLAPVNGSPPTMKMCEAVFKILRAGKHLDLIMGSFWLLRELDKRFPRMSVSDASESKEPQFVMSEEAWCPFVLNLDASHQSKEAVNKSNDRPLDSLGFHLLIQELVEFANKIQSPETKSLSNLLLFQYLVDVLEGDFMMRNKLFEETLNWIHLRESLLNLLLNSRKIQYKNFIRHCLILLCGLSHPSAESRVDVDMNDDVLESDSRGAVGIASAEVRHNTCTALQKLLVAIMELDVSRKKADAQGSTTRADGARTPLLELVLDEVIYDSDMLSPFLQGFDEPKWKTELILQYFMKYAAKPTVRTRRSNTPSEDLTISGTLKGFSNITTSKSIAKKIGSDIVQVLIAHGFQAHLSLCSSKQDGDGVASPAEMCEDVITAFTNLKTANQQLEILPIGKEALFTAAMILSTKS